MAGFTAITPSINVNTQSGQLRTELLNTFLRLDGQLQAAPYRLSTQNGPTGNTDAAETTMQSFQLNYNTLSKLGASIQIFACGKTAANANTKTFKFKLGSTTLFTSGAIALNNKDWTFRGEIVANGSTSQIFYGEFTSNGAAPIVTTTTASEDLGTNLTIAFAGQGTTTGDIQQYFYKAVLIG
jgi:hypothetical protein